MNTTTYTVEGYELTRTETRENCSTIVKWSIETRGIPAVDIIIENWKAETKVGLRWGTSGTCEATDKAAEFMSELALKMAQAARIQAFIDTH